MLPLDHPDRIQITFDDRRLVAMLGCSFRSRWPSTWVCVNSDLNAPGRANPGDKMLTLVASALAGGDCIDDADVLRTGGTAQTLGCVVKAPSTLGTFLRSFRWGHVRQLDRVSRELLARAWAAGAGPGDAPFTIDLDSTICETYGLAKEGARDHGYTGKRGYHPLLAVAAGTGDADGPAARSGCRPLRETVGCATPGPGDNSRAGRQRLLHPRHRRRLPPDGSASPSPSARVLACAVSSRPYPSRTGRPSPTGWRAPPMWPKPATLPSRASRTPRRCGSSSGPTPGSQLALFATYSYHGFITDREGETLELEADHRRHAEIENAIRDLKYGVGLNHLPSGRFPANGAWLAVQVIAHNLARWTARIGLGEQIVTTKTLRRRFFSMAGRLTRSARRLTLHLPQRWPWEAQFSGALARFRALPLPS